MGGGVKQETLVSHVLLESSRPWLMEGGGVKQETVVSHVLLESSRPWLMEEGGGVNRKHWFLTSF